MIQTYFLQNGRFKKKEQILVKIWLINMIQIKFI